MKYMGYDIYGERLERGHCEVHPWVGETYPCTLCYNENNKRNEERKQHDKAEREWREAIENEQNEFEQRQLAIDEIDQQDLAERWG